MFTVTPHVRHVPRSIKGQLRKVSPTFLGKVDLYKFSGEGPQICLPTFREIRTTSRGLSSGISTCEVRLHSWKLRPVQKIYLPGILRTNETKYNIELLVVITFIYKSLLFCSWILIIHRKPSIFYFNLKEKEILRLRAPKSSMVLRTRFLPSREIKDAA